MLLVLSRLSNENIDRLVRMYWGSAEWEFMRDWTDVRLNTFAHDRTIL